MNERTKKLTMSVSEAAEELGVCDATLYKLARTKGFPAIRIGRKIRISREGLKEWAKDGRVLV